MEKVSIVRASGEKHIDAIVFLANKIWGEHYTPIIGKPQVDYMLGKFQSKEAILGQIGKEGHFYYLLEDKNHRPLGYLGVVSQDKELFLSKLYINAEDRGKGHGKEAVRFIEKMARKKRLPKIGLMVNKNNAGSIRAYEKLGFNIAGSVVTDIGNGFVMHDYRMEKIIE